MPRRSDRLEERPCGSASYERRLGRALAVLVFAKVGREGMIPGDNARKLRDPRQPAGSPVGDAIRHAKGVAKEKLTKKCGGELHPDLGRLGCLSL